MPPKLAIPLAASVLGLAVVGVMWQASAIDPLYGAVLLPSPVVDEPMPEQPALPNREVAVFAGGCFWGVQAVFEHVQGVDSAISGYTGGSTTNPTYDQVSLGQTGQAEAVAITFDPKVVSYGTLLKVFFSVVTDPTEVDRQGPDIGNQYRSEVYATTPAQGQVANAYIAQLSNAEVYAAPIVTKVEPLVRFWRAEAEHQDYVTRHQNDIYVEANDLPRLVNLRDMFPALWRDKAVLAAPET